MSAPYRREDAESLTIQAGERTVLPNNLGLINRTSAPVVVKWWLPASAEVVEDGTALAVVPDREWSWAIMEAIPAVLMS